MDFARESTYIHFTMEKTIDEFNETRVILFL